MKHLQHTQAVGVSFYWSVFEVFFGLSLIWFHETLLLFCSNVFLWEALHLQNIFYETDVSFVTCAIRKYCM